MRLPYLLFVSAAALWAAPTTLGQSSATRLAPASATAGSGYCTDYVSDQANPAACIQASTTPTAGMLLPLGPEFFVSPTGEVGVGTTSPITKLGVDGGLLPGIFASTDAFDASAITGWAPAGTGSYAFGVYGESDGDGGTGVLGWATDLTGGFTYGLYGQADSGAGTGVFGWATDLVGATAGVSGEADSAAGAGVFGWASDTTGGYTSGVLGESDSPAGAGVYGWASDATGGYTSGVYGVSDSANGVGAFGWASDAAGATVGVSGQADSALGTGVLGWSTSPTGTTTGVRGVSSADLGAGVEGYALEATGANYGVYGETASTAGYGVFSGGDLGATGVKSFVQPHPSDPGKEIRFVCLEGDESGTYFRGSGELVTGAARIAGPAAFSMVSELAGLTVQLTPVGGRAVLWTEGESLESIEVRGDADVRFHYFVNGVRRGFADFEPIRANRAFVPRVAGEQFGTQYPEGLRQILRENGTLSADGTPNESTALRQGWQLQQPGSASHLDRPVTRPRATVPDARGMRTRAGATAPAPLAYIAAATGLT
ncbi:MAG: hypothetical protein QF724_09150 [Planctomycetota bacterium]|nr:hypothetical protein [Planctomycetota bacterium]